MAKPKECRPDSRGRPPTQRNTKGLRAGCLLIPRIRLPARPGRPHFVSLRYRPRPRERHEMRARPPPQQTHRFSGIRARAGARPDRPRDPARTSPRHPRARGAAVWRGWPAVRARAMPPAPARAGRRPRAGGCGTVGGLHPRACGNARRAPALRRRRARRCRITRLVAFRAPQFVIHDSDHAIAARRIGVRPAGVLGVMGRSCSEGGSAAPRIRTSDDARDVRPPSQSS